MTTITIHASPTTLALVAAFLMLLVLWPRHRR